METLTQTNFWGTLGLHFVEQLAETYPTVVQGKPTDIWTIPAFFPVMFELTILLSAFTTLFGLLGLIAEHGGFPGTDAAPVVGSFEYWSLARKGEAFGYRESPVDPLGKRDKIITADFTSGVHEQFEGIAAAWLNGSAPFDAQVNPEVASYGDYDQLMRLEEWYGRQG